MIGDPIEQYAANVATDTETLAADIDAEISALTGGVANQTVSMRVALAAKLGKRWAIAFCAFLSAAVQCDHCQVTLDGGLIPWWAFVRAAICFAVVIGGVGWILFTLMRALVEVI